MGKAAESTALSMICEVVFGVGFAPLLPVFFGLDGVLFSMPVSDFLTFLVLSGCVGVDLPHLSSIESSHWNVQNKKQVMTFLVHNVTNPQEGEPQIP